MQDNSATEPPATYGSSGVLIEPAHAITDSTKLDSHMTCSRKMFYEHILGWKLETPNVHLHAGSAVHLMMERLLHLAHRDGGLSEAHIDEAFALFETEYRRYFNPEDDYLRAPKDPTNVRWAVTEYVKRYKGENLTPLYTEVVGAVPLDENGKAWMHLKLDAILDDPARGVVIRDFKTAKAGYLNDSWATKWALTIQFLTYTHAALCLFDSDRFWGVEIDGIGLDTPPRLRKDGEVYESDKNKGPKFRRVSVQYTPDAFEKSFHTVRHYYDELQRDFDRLTSDTPDSPIMQAFPEKWSACTAYGGCQFIAFCRARSNPLRHDLSPPIGFKREFWSPLADEHAKCKLSFDLSLQEASITPITKEEGNQQP